MRTPSHTRGHSARGMTLVEILAVVVILGLIAGTLMVGFSGMFGQAKHDLARTGIGVVTGKIEAYRIQTGSWPSNELGLAALTNGEATPTDPYYLTNEQLTDPWNRPFYFIIPGPDGHPYEVGSYGADGEPGGDGENADISSASLGSGE